MPHSNFFNELKIRIDELKNHMLPEFFSPTGVYEEKELDLTKGYILLAHAEFESYIEEVSKYIILETVRNWKRNNKPSLTLLSFLCCYHSSWSINDEVSNEDVIKIAKNRVNVKESTNEVIDIALKQYVQKIKDNHGIKEANFKSLVLPTGINIEELDGSLIVAMDSFGSARGEVAHLSKQRVKNLIDPQDEYNKVNSIISGLAGLDLKIQELLMPQEKTFYSTPENISYAYRHKNPGSTP